MYEIQNIIKWFSNLRFIFYLFVQWNIYWVFSLLTVQIPNVCTDKLISSSDGYGVLVTFVFSLAVFFTSISNDGCSNVQLALFVC